MTPISSPITSPQSPGMIRIRPEMPTRVHVEHDIAELLRRQETRKQRIHDRPNVEMLVTCCNVWWRVVTRCNVLWCTVTCCNV